MLYDYYCKKIIKASKKDIFPIVKFIKDSFDSPKNDLDEIKTSVFLKLTKKLKELNSNEYIIHIIPDLNLLNEIIEKHNEDKNFLLYAFSSTLIKNGRYEEIVENNDFFMANIDKASENFEPLSFNVAMSLRKLERIDEAIKVIENIKTFRCMLELALLYSIKNDKKELDIYNKVLSENRTSDEKIFVYLGYAKYFIKNNMINDCKKYIEKLIKTMPKTEENYRSIRYYEIALLLKKVGEDVDSAYYLERSAKAKVFGEIEYEYKLKSIFLLLELNYLSKDEVSSLVRNEDNFKYSELITNKIHQLEEVLNEKII